MHAKLSMLRGIRPLQRQRLTCTGLLEASPELSSSCRQAIGITQSISYRAMPSYLTYEANMIDVKACRNASFLAQGWSTCCRAFCGSGEMRPSLTVSHSIQLAHGTSLPWSILRIWISFHFKPLHPPYHLEVPLHVLISLQTTCDSYTSCK